MQLRGLLAEAPAVRLRRSCAPGDGIVRLEPHEEADCLARFADLVTRTRLMKFVAASGAGTRMFEDLRARINSGEAANSLAGCLPQWAFFDDLKAAMAAAGEDVEATLAAGRWRRVLEFLLYPPGLDYLDRPKALVPYHRYPDGIRTALDEHILEAAGHACGAGGVVRVHFTIRSKHEKLIRQHIQRARTHFGLKAGEWEITTSVQDESASAIVIGEDGEPVRDGEGKLVFSSPGHGALLANLNAIDAGVIFVRTVDNVFPDRLKPFVSKYKRILAGHFMALEERVHSALRALAASAGGERAIREAEKLAVGPLFVRLPESWAHWRNEEKKDFLFSALNRPLRVCGVVPQEGKPGGAPFWVADASGGETLRIVEACEVDRQSCDQLRLWLAARYFNPVDIVCSVRDYLGRKFRLADFQDRQSHLVVVRSHNGRTVRMIEQPGLWNGGMAGWNTVFVEVPAATVHPVKSVFDLLDPRHTVTCEGGGW